MRIVQNSSSYKNPDYWTSKESHGYYGVILGNFGEKPTPDENVDCQVAAWDGSEWRFFNGRREKGWDRPDFKPVVKVELDLSELMEHYRGSGRIKVAKVSNSHMLILNSDFARMPDGCDAKSFYWMLKRIGVPDECIDGVDDGLNCLMVNVNGRIDRKAKPWFNDREEGVASMSFDKKTGIAVLIGGWR